MRKIKMKFRKTNKRRWDELLTYSTNAGAQQNEFHER